jgi:tetratricopeptide (TPR) repeat protein
MTALYKIAQNFLAITLAISVKHKQLLLLMLFFAQHSYSSNVAPSSADRLFSAATVAAYQDLIQNKKTVLTTEDIDRIIKVSESAIASKDTITATTTILVNMPAITRQIHLPQIQQIAALALSLHNIAIAESLLKVAKNQGDTSSEVRIIFELAKYNADQGQWGNVITMLKDSGVIENLGKDDADESNLLIGNALQQQKKHREAIAFYEKVKANSPHYRLAQLNLSTAYIRQDWWSDAHVAIQNALKISPSKKDDLDYRLYTVLGYSQIQFGFYRDARESFRNVSLKSSYTNRALLGLGMAALHQEDFIGALTAFNHLRGKKDNDISVAESYLLSAFTLRQLGQHEAAVTGYQEAIAYYSILNKKQAATLSNLVNRDANSPSIDAIFLRPESRNNKPLRQLAEKIHLLDNLLTQPLSNGHVTALTNSKTSLQKDYLATAQQLLAAEQEAITSYLSQSKFGLATLYDGK